MKLRLRLLLPLILFPVLAGAAPAPDPNEGAGSIHPLFPLLDESGTNVLESGGPVSAVRTCGACHDAEFIERESPHAGAGWGGPRGRERGPGNTPDGRPWESGTGIFGGWNPITYRALSRGGEDPIDLSLPDWIRFFGRRHVGGGPAHRSADGSPLSEKRSAGPDDPEASWFDPDTNRREPWDWGRSGSVEMNCFLCHLPDPDNEGRVAALEAGAFRWATTLTLRRTGAGRGGKDGWRWNPEAFDGEGRVKRDRVRVEDPTNAHCGQCHGLVHGDPEMPVLLKGCAPEYWTTLTTGQILSPQRISESGINLRGKENLTRSWDVHAERMVSCVDCHHSVNNPIYRRSADAPGPDHLIFDARRMSMGEYLKRPSHRLARAGDGPDGRARGGPGRAQECEGCHLVEKTHEWLPYWKRHVDVLSCNACHAPRLYAPARRTIDWTVLTPERKPRTVCRGGGSAESDPLALVEGYEPVLLPRAEHGAGGRLHPHNLVSSWFWVGGEPARPVGAALLAEAFFDRDGYREEILAALDEDGDGRLAETELVLDTPDKTNAVRGRLLAAGALAPRIAAEVRPYPIAHGVAAGEWATKECRACHGRDSRLSREFLLAETPPGGVAPAAVSSAGAALAGEIVRDPAGRISFVPSTGAMGLHVLGHDASRSANLAGIFGVGGVVLGIAAHGALRLRASRRAGTRRGPPAGPWGRVRMYGAYERLWHWLQALAVLVLLVTGVAVHLPGRVPLLDFALSVRVHNIIGFLVVINAALAAFYHLASGEIRQYIPERGNFFSQAIELARYYLRGVFRSEPHPFAKRPGRKLNALQQVTYLAILNVLLPLQTVTGVLIWGAHRWPGVDSTLGGLALLAPLHAAGAWLFAAFLVLHVYLT
ncbi:MAG: cytochrome b/b6 domain-containing protein, partial [Candidatus Eisenbacteria bacterium]